MVKKLKFMIFISLALVLLPIANARPITDIFANGLLDINNFFTGRQWEPYSSIIDFFLFSVLFISIYMIGARYAFKEIKKPERVIVILLGLMTAFLLVLAGFSITLLLPYVNWIVFLLAFLFLIWILKGINGKFLRFVIALLVILLILSLMQAFFSFASFRFCDVWYFNWLIFILTFILWLFVLRKAIKNIFWRFVVALLLAFLIFFVFQKICGAIPLPEISRIGTPEVPSSLSLPALPNVFGWTGPVGSFFSDFSRNFQGINLGFRPGMPDWAGNLFGSRSSSTGTVPESVTTPVIPPKAQIKESIFGQVAGINPAKYDTQESYDKAADEAYNSGPKEIGSPDGKKYKFFKKDGKLTAQEVGWIYNSDVPSDKYNDLQISLEKKKSTAAPSTPSEGSTTGTPIPAPSQPAPTAQPKKGFFERYWPFGGTTTPSPAPAPQPPPSSTSQTAGGKKSETVSTDYSKITLYILVALLAMSLGSLVYRVNSINQKRKLKKAESLGRRLVEPVRNSIEALNQMTDAAQQRVDKLKAAERQTAFLSALTKGLKEPALLMTDEGREALSREHQEVEDILKQEYTFIDGTKKLGNAESDLLKTIRNLRRGR